MTDPEQDLPSDTGIQVGPPTHPRPPPMPTSRPPDEAGPADGGGGPESGAPEGWLLMLTEDDALKRIPLSDGLTIGRARDCTISLDDALVSRRHAKVAVEAGRFVLEDTRSQNGTFVNGLRVNRQTLRHGDLLRLGHTRARVELRAERLADDRPFDEAGAWKARPVNPRAMPSLLHVSQQAFFEALGVAEGTPDDGITMALRRHTRQFAVLFEISREVQEARSQDEMLQRCLRLLLTVLDADRGVVVLRDTAGQLRPACGLDQAGKPHANPALLMSRTVCEKVVDQRIGVFANDPPAEFPTAESVVFNSVRALISVPMIVADRVVGLIEITCRHPARRFDDVDLTHLSVAGSLVGTALESLHHAAEREATIRELRATELQLRSTQDQLVQQERVASLGALSMRVAHELRNHLTPIQGIEEIAERYPDDDELNETISVAVEALETVRDLVTEIQSYAQPKVTRRAAWKATDLAEIARSAARYLRDDDDVRRVILDLELLPVPTVFTQPRRVRQVLINLLRNAAQATRGPDPRVTLRLKGAPDGVLLEVEDNGVGMPPEVAARVFDAFFSTKEGRGLGLGLEISRNIVAQHGGQLTFETCPGRGTCFRVKLPLDPTAHQTGS